MPKPAPLQLENQGLTFSALEAGVGPTVILMHGFPDTLQTWQAQLQALADGGFRAVAVAMRGYEPSSQPDDGNYSGAALAGDVAAWIAQLGSEPVHLVGHDWGASVAYGVATACPEKLLSLTTLAVPHSGRFLADIAQHPRQLRMSWYMLFFQLRGISDRVVRRRRFAFLRQLWRTWSPGWEFSDEEFERVAMAFAAPGVVPAALAYYRAALSPGALAFSRAAREELRWTIPVPTLGITGAQEGCIAADTFRAMMHEEDFPRGLRVREIENAGHFVHREQPEEVNALILAWLRGHTPG